MRLDVTIVLAVTHYKKGLRFNRVQRWLGEMFSSPFSPMTRALASSRQHVFIQSFFFFFILSDHFFDSLKKEMRKCGQQFRGLDRAIKPLRMGAFLFFSYKDTS